jgi:hypothetical protein
VSLALTSLIASYQLEADTSIKNQVEFVEKYLHDQIIALLQKSKYCHDQISSQLPSSTPNAANTIQGYGLSTNPWHIEASQSKVTDAGNGCWLKGAVEQGHVVAIAPGLSLSPNDVTLLLTIAGDKFKDNGWLLARHDGWIVDGRIEPDQRESNSYQMWQMALSKEKIAKKERLPNPFALGHLINHSKSPNTTPISYNFDLTKIPEELHPYIPNALFSPRADNKIPSILFVTLRNVDNEELFFDYNFKPDEGKELPSWYSK